MEWFMINLQHKKQFVIGSREIKLPNFKAVKLQADKYLSYSEDINIFVEQNSECSMILLGHAFQTKSKFTSVEAELVNMKPGAPIDNITENWTGRWVLIFNNEIHMDAAGTLGCFYTENSDENWVSSSLALLNEITPLTNRDHVIKVEHGSSLNWYPGPLTIYCDVKRLMSDEVLCVSDEFSVKYRKSIVSICSEISDKDIVNQISESLTTAMQNIDKYFDGDILLPLTAGVDSRTLLSVCLQSDVKFSSFTQEHDNISSSDIRVPYKLSRMYKFNYNYITRNKPLDEFKLRMSDAHTFYQSMDADRLFFAHDQYRELNKSLKNKIIIRGGIWEFAREFYSGINVTEDADNLEKMNDLTIAFPILNKSKFHYDSLMAWIEKCEKNPLDLSLRNRFYLEQRVGAWLSSIEQGLDITDYSSIHLINSKVLLSLLNALSNRSKLSGQHQLNMIRALESRLLDIPFNKLSLHDKFKNNIRYAKATLKDEGVKELAKKIMNKINI